MKISMLEVALVELEDAVDFYNDECPGLGYEFADEVFNIITRVSRNPLSWQLLSLSARRCLTHRFPYAVIYRVREDQIIVAAIMHLHRNPNSWKNR